MAASSEKHQPSQGSAAAEVGLPMSVAEPTLIAYRSVGIGIFGAVMRFMGMPLEKIALFSNSSQVSGKNQLAQAVRLTFKEGALAPYRVVGPASLVAWFLQYSVVGAAFQCVDKSLSHLLGVRPAYYGKELMEPPRVKSGGGDDEPWSDRIKFGVKTVVTPLIASMLESKVANRAAVQRYFGPAKFAAIEKSMSVSSLSRLAGPAYGANVMRNVIMCNTTFLLTPTTYKLYFPQELKSTSSLFWYGLGMNMCVGNVLAITQQSLWGRSLDYLAENGKISYRLVIQQGLQKDGIAAFFTAPKWFSRVLMNAPCQGSLPWFYNEVLPMGERRVLEAVKTFVYDPFLNHRTIAHSGTQPGVALSPQLRTHITTVSPR